eukprot:TRINITY_DN8895_c0_g1_i5.p1 TRINITY_DN8895_c0_g1~~TRINITY_DN8895_c0_g1_i5.p1  ORF type:complete len:219 (-),score=41.61 TRINITY_DN8895_c0_g1_i5:148-804(-)
MLTKKKSQNNIISVSSCASTIVEGKSLNILMLGETQVGKTALIKVYNGETFPSQHYTTLGTEFIVKKVQVGEELVKAKVWDTAGQERFRTITKAFYQQAQGILLVYDVTKRETYSKLSMWIDNMQDCANSEVAKCLVANKVDLAYERTVSTEEGKEMAHKYSMDYHETSARLNKNVQDTFEFVIAKAHTCRDKLPGKESLHLSSISSFKVDGNKTNCC